MTTKQAKRPKTKSQMDFPSLDDQSVSDSSESEESVYSGLEEEPDTTDEEEQASKDDEDDDESDEDDGSDEDDDEINEKEEQVQEIEDEENSDDDNEDNIAVEEVKSDNNKSISNSAPVKEGITLSAPDEYDYDSSDEEDIRNTIGNIPLEWYRDYSHIGYDIEGRKLLKPKKSDELDEFLNKMDNPDYWRTVTDKLTGQKILLNEKDLNLIKNIQGGQYHDSQQNTYEPWIDFFTYEKMIHPVTNRPEHKRSFIPSKWEKLKVGQMVHALKMGWMKPSKPKTDEDEEEDEKKFFMMWKDDEEPDITKRYKSHIPAPKLSLPGHEESYNPPPEYLPTKEEEQDWLNADPEDRKKNFLPKKYSSLRLVPAYKRFINERFDRCLDLYLCPRQQKIKMNVNPEDLIPKLPKPRDLQPFPTVQAIIYRGHKDMVRSISVDPTGQWIASGSDDETVKFWEIATGRCMKTVQIGSPVKCIAWNPNHDVSLVAIAIDCLVLLVNPGLGDKVLVSNTDNVLESFESPEESSSSTSKTAVEWNVYSGKKYESGYRLGLPHPKEVTQVTWHGKGDYFASVMPKGDSSAVLIHQLSRRKSQNPFSKSKGLVQCVLFHPVRPFLFVATQRYVRVYNLLKQELTKKLMTNCKWVSSMSVHSGGDNVIIGSYDCRLSWFDLDLSTKPYQTLRHHKKAVRQVCYHRRYPLFASASDDGTVIVCHGMVYNDLLQNPLIVPVKILKGHSSTKDLGVLDCVFHPTQPWVFSSGADGTIRLYT